MGRSFTIDREVIYDGFCVRLTDRRTERVDHLCNLGLSLRRVEKRRVHRDVIKAMAGAAIRLDKVEAGGSLERDRIFLRGGPRQ